MLAVVFLIPVPILVVGIPAFLVALALALRDPEAALRRRLSVLLGCVAILAICDINTSLSTANFLQVGIPFALVVILPPLIFRKRDPGVIRYRFLPVHWRKADIIYTILSVPLAWGILKGYWAINPDIYQNWSMAEEFDEGEVKRLFLGINMVGIWDELFFVNTVFATMRSLFSFRVANFLQAVVYTAVLYDMAFTGIGPLLVFAFAWTQGSMFEKSEGLIWVLIVHLIVDFFLVAFIVGSHHPGVGYDFLWTHGL